MEKISFENLPHAVTMLTKEVSELKKLLIEQQKSQINTDEKYLSIQDASQFLNLSVASIYGKCSKQTIPHIKKGKKLYFVKNDLINYLNQGRKKTVSEIEQEVRASYKNKGGKNA